MLNVHNLSVSFGGQFIYEQVSFMIKAGDRIGLVGKNGAGKSTLLKILAKEMTPDTGVMATDKEVKIGFLKQDIEFEQGRTILEETYQAFTEIKEIESKMELINQQLTTRTDYESDEYSKLLIDLSDLTQRYDLLGGYYYPGEAEKVLLGLGFERDHFDKQTSTLSGGWRMRIELAKILLQNNDLLLLDEPTNHLDIESIIWLESFLNNFSGAVVIVSHDKMFLDNVTNRTIEISLGKIYDYNKPYTQYTVMRQELRELQKASQKNQKKQIAHTEKLIEKFRAKASKASMAQSLIKKLDKIERIEVDEEDHAVMHVHFPVHIQPGKVIATIEHVSKSYGEKQVLQDVNLLIERGSKVAFVGQNGQGKSTLAKIIVGEIPFEGKVTLGHNVKIGYFAQNQAEYLNGNLTVLDTMIEAANETNRSKVRDILGAFLFRGEEVDKFVRVLSGGERNRLALAKLLLQPLNVLIMDEPTNHLDIQSKNVLKKALQQFEGTLILVSHDREFLQGLCSQVFEFKDHQIKEFIGDIDFYLEQRNLSNLREAEAKTIKYKQEKTTTPPPKDLKKEKALKNKISKLESNIQQVEREISDMELQLANNYSKLSQDTRFFEVYNRLKATLEDKMAEWEQATVEMDNI